ncbi:hypothetical protein [Paenibacillus bovis]|uniref:Uncharacterized protein n=1 Tax=Paenibacillus bovis TaxID=1616788 RepID=A0A172ZF22_9BACL|nr:hypothetical protein [Paenibacillus bovis]ANF96254.1 hypothetical protein AR543_09745 [Paenibacillus bovis]
MITFISITATIACIVFLILAIQSKKKKSPKARKQFNAATIFLFLVILMVIINPDKSSAVQPSQSAITGETAKLTPKEKQSIITESVESKELKQTGNIGMTPNEFKKLFNKQSAQIESDLSIRTVNIEKGPARDVFKYDFSDDLSLIGFVNKKDGSLSEIKIMTQAKTKASAIDFLLAFGTTVLATNPKSDPDAAKKVGKELGVFDKDVDFTTIDSSTIYDGVNYRIKNYDNLGLIFSVGSSND